MMWSPRQVHKRYKGGAPQGAVRRNSGSFISSSAVVKVCPVSQGSGHLRAPNSKQAMLLAKGSIVDTKLSLQRY